MVSQTRAQSPGAPPSPEGGWSQEVQTVTGGIVVPPVDSATVQDCGVVAADGSFVAHSATWRGARQMMTEPEGPVVPAAKLAGRHLFAGQLWHHFGHFLAESISRLWALGNMKEKPESIIFIPKRPGKVVSLHGYQKEFFDLLGIDIPIRIVDVPTEVEELLVPGQGFGLGDIAQGTQAFRSYFAEHFGREIAPAGEKNIYLSRRLLGGLEGSAVLEDVLEDNLAAEGFAPYHPQKHGLSAQIAQYKAAEKIIGLDGSAFHLFGFVGRPEQKVAIILRRNSNVFHGLRSQIVHFAGIEPALVNVVLADWIPEHKARPGRYSFGQLDFEAVRERLRDEGFISGKADWVIPRFRDAKRAMAQLSRKKGHEYVRLKARERPTDREAAQ